MRKRSLIPLLLLFVLLGACGDITGSGSRSLDGEWGARVDGETVWFSLRDSRGDIRGDGEWGYDYIHVDGERFDRDVYLVFDFNRYNPIEFEGRVNSSEIDGRLYGSGYDGVRVRFRRESRR